MKQTMDLNKMGLASMSNIEMEETDGGSFWGWLAGGLGVVLGIGIIIGSAGLATGAGLALLFEAGFVINGDL